MKRILYVFGLLILSAPCFAQGTFTAASCSQAAVNAVINGPTHTAANGDTISIPAGTCTWTSGITINGVGIDIKGTGTPNAGGGTFGAGATNTTLIDNAGGPILDFTNLSFGETAKVELLTLSAAGAGTNTIYAGIAFSGTCTSSGCANIRVDNINFATNTWGGPGSGGLVAINDVFGVVDHNTANENPSSFGGGAGPALLEINYASWQGVGDWGDNSFATANTFGTAQAMYMENNSLNYLRLSDNDVTTGANPGGARYVCRFNEITNMNGTGICSAHGTGWGGRMRGMRQVEMYYNDISGTNCNVITGLSSGTGYYFSNSYTGSGCNAVVNLGSGRGTSSQGPWFACDGTQPWDQSPWSSSTACLDQVGTSVGPLLAGTSTAPVLASALQILCTVTGQCWPNPARSPIYEAGDVLPNSAVGVNVTSDGTQLRVLANRDFYSEVSTTGGQTSPTSPFNGASGTGYGTLANRPTTCATGVGYWATDQGNWNTYNSLQSGELYICTATNTWSMNYEPYTYPHPLITGGSSGGGGSQSVLPPATVNATVQQ